MIRRIGIAALIAVALGILILVWPVMRPCLPLIGVGSACRSTPIDVGSVFIHYIFVAMYAPPVLATIVIWLVIEVINFIRERFFS